MNWVLLRHFPWLDTRARFVWSVPRGGALLDLGSADGETLNHIAQLRPDLRLFASDKAGTPEKYPVGCQFHRADLEHEPLPWSDNSMDAITCMHLIEHMRDLDLLLREIARLLKPGGFVYFETPHPKSLVLSSPAGSAAGTFTLNFYDDLTHVQLMPIGRLAKLVSKLGLRVIRTGCSRNWLFALAYPVLMFSPPSRKKYTARVHWLGWSAYLVAQKLHETETVNN